MERKENDKYYKFYKLQGTDSSLFKSQALTFATDQKDGRKAILFRHSLGIDLLKPSIHTSVRLAHADPSFSWWGFVYKIILNFSQHVDISINIYMIS